MQFAFSVTKVCKTDVATHAIAMLFVNPYLLIWPEPYNQACSSYIMEELVEEFQDIYVPHEMLLLLSYTS